jgi:hypothetical protein
MSKYYEDEPTYIWSFGVAAMVILILLLMTRCTPPLSLLVT